MSGVGRLAAQIAAIARGESPGLVSAGIFRIGVHIRTSRDRRTAPRRVRPWPSAGPICPMGWTSHAARLSPAFASPSSPRPRPQAQASRAVDLSDLGEPRGQGAHRIAKQRHPHPRRRGPRRRSSSPLPRGRTPTMRPRFCRNHQLILPYFHRSKSPKYPSPLAFHPIAGIGFRALSIPSPRAPKRPVTRLGNRWGEVCSKRPLNLRCASLSALFSWEQSAQIRECFRV